MLGLQIYTLIIYITCIWIHINSAAVSSNDPPNAIKNCLGGENGLKGGGDPLVNLGHISAQIIQSMAQAKDGKVDLDEVATFVMSLSKGTALIKHQDIYKEPEQIESQSYQRLEASIERLETQLRQSQVEMTSMKVKLARMEGVQQQLALLENDLRDTNDTILGLIEGKSDNVEEHFIGFTASKTENQVLYNGTIVTFDRELFDFGDVYNTNSSVFTCPKRGIYVVSTRIETYDSQGFMVNVEVIDPELPRLYTTIYQLHTHSDSGMHDSASGSAITECNQGQQIRFRSMDGGRIHGTFPAYGSGHRSFISIYLMKYLD